MGQNCSHESEGVLDKEYHNVFTQFYRVFLMLFYERWRHMTVVDLL